jgi:hypothetical protein
MRKTILKKSGIQVILRKQVPIAKPFLVKMSSIHKNTISCMNHYNEWQDEVL